MVGIDPRAAMRVSDPAEFDLLKAVIERAEELARDERQDLAVRTARAMNGKST